MSDRRCKWCGGSLEGRDPRAKTCSTNCRVRDWEDRTSYGNRYDVSIRSNALPALPGQKRGARAVYALLKQRGDRGAVTSELCQPGIGGCRFGARVQELRDAGCTIARVQLRPGRWRYWLTVDPFDVPVPRAPAREPEPDRLPLEDAA
jgi:hypothetical protein